MDEQEIRPPEIMPNLLLLKILCIFTFIGSGLGSLSYGLIGLLHGFFSENLSLVPDEKNREMIALMLTGGRFFFYLSSLFYGISFAGALLMWKMRKAGFHMYTASQLLILILPMAFIKGFPMPGFTIFLTLAFVWGYYGFLKLMK
jgi:hypothetical protein